MPIEPTTQAFLDAVAAAGAPPLQTLSPEDARAVLLGVQDPGAPRPDADIEDVLVPGGPTGHVRARIVRPAGVAGPLPAVLYFHGGGWVLGDATTHDRLVRALAAGSGAAIVFVDYDRSPEARWPVAIEQGHAAARYVADRGARHGLDGTRLAVAGDSAGGTLATALALLSRARGGPTFVYQALFYPVTDARFDTWSYKEFSEGPWLTRAAMRWFWDCYVPDRAYRTDPTAAPLHAWLGQLKGLPPTYLATAEHDVLRDEGEAYAARLAQAGVPVTSVRYNGAIHDFVLLDALRDTPAAKAAIGQASAALREALHAGAPARARVPEPA